MSLSSAALLGFGNAGLMLDAAATNMARASDPTATAVAVDGGSLAATSAPIDPAADSVTLSQAAVQMAVAAKLLKVEKQTQQALIDVMA
jgi:hypothetical protein